MGDSMKGIAYLVLGVLIMIMILGLSWSLTSDHGGADCRCGCAQYTIDGGRCVRCADCSQNSSAPTMTHQEAVDEANRQAGRDAGYFK